MKDNKAYVVSWSTGAWEDYEKFYIPVVYLNKDLADIKCQDIIQEKGSKSPFPLKYCTEEQAEEGQYEPNFFNSKEDSSIYAKWCVDNYKALEFNTATVEEFTIIE